MFRSSLVLAVFVLSASVSMAQVKGGRGPLPNVNPTTTSSTKVIPTRVTQTTTNPQSTNPQTTTNPRVTINPQSTTNPRVTIEPGTGKVIVTRTTINPQTQVVVTTIVVTTRVTYVVPTQVITPVKVVQVIPPGVVVYPPGGGFGWGNCCCSCGWYTEVMRFFGFEPAAIPMQDSRFLRLHNDTDEKIKVFVRVYTHDLNNAWEWHPEAPGPGASKWMAFDMEPNMILEPRMGELQVAGNRIRIFAQSATKSWSNYRDQDFWIVPETTTSGEHLYYAPARETYQFYIHNSSK